MPTPNVTEILKAYRRGDYIEVEWKNSTGQVITTGGYVSSAFVQQLFTRARLEGHL